MPRPDGFSQEIADAICERIICGGSIRNICKADDMPAASTVFLWLAKERTFSEQYARACEARTHYMAEEMIDIADDGTNDFKPRSNDDDTPVVDSEHIQRSKVRIDTRKWLMSKLAPKKYGDKLALTDPTGEGPLQVVIQRFAAE